MSIGNISAAPPTIFPPAPPPQNVVNPDSFEEYYMVQIPRLFNLQRQTEAAELLQKLVNEHAMAGWQFYRIDEIGVITTPGCLGSLLGATSIATPYYIITFKRPKYSKA